MRWLAPWSALFLVLPALNVALPGPTGVMKRMSNVTISIIAYDYLLNLDQRVLSIDWVILGCGENTLPEYLLQGFLADLPQCGPFNLTADIYLNDASNRVLSYNPYNLPVDPMHRPLLTRELVSFRTNHELHPSGPSADSYIFHAFAFAIDPSTNLPVDVALFTIAGLPDGFATSSRRTTVSGGFVPSTDDGSTMVEIEAWTLEVKYRRSKLSGALTLCMFAMSWALTLGSVCVTLMAMTKGAVSLTTIVLHAFTALAILGLWGGWLGGRSFGTYPGFLGFFLQITTAAVCFALLLYVAAKPRRGCWQPEKA